MACANHRRTQVQSSQRHRAACVHGELVAVNEGRRPGQPEFIRALVDVPVFRFGSYFYAPPSSKGPTGVTGRYWLDTEIFYKLYGYLSIISKYVIK